jgi:glycoprotein-N-acetylgalactosamine 3-beta-galactosyltransferase
MVPLRRVILLVLVAVILVAIGVAYQTFYEGWGEPETTSQSTQKHAKKYHCHTKLNEALDERFPTFERRCNSYHGEAQCHLSDNNECVWDVVLAAEEWCRRMKRKHKVLPYRSWGTMSKADIAQWQHKHCSSKTGGRCPSPKSPSDQLLDKIQLWRGAVKGKPRIMCMVYTTAAEKAKMQTQLNAWGGDCDGFMFMSDEDDPALQAIRLEHKGPEKYQNMWQKLRAIWAFAYQVYGGGVYSTEVLQRHPDLVTTADKFKRAEREAKRGAKGARLPPSPAPLYDYFVVGGTDLFLIVENLRQYLLSADIAPMHDDGVPLYLGRRFKQPAADHAFNSGGAGYVLNRHALKVLANSLPLAECTPDLEGFWEDVQTGYCLHWKGVHALNTTDDLWEERFHPFYPALQVSQDMASPGEKPGWFEEYTLPFAPTIDTAGGPKQKLRTGLDCCSKSTISFHYVEHNNMHSLKRRLACRLDSKT